MSTSVDNKVVEMTFDNKQFESNVQTSLSTIDRLKQSLNFNGASKGLENVNTATKNVNMSGLGNAVEQVRSKFSAMEVMAVTALANITNSAVNTGKRMVSALTIDPITTGFQEYETQINAVQTILANTSSKGTTLGQVNKALNELNTYADKTIYNFTEMTRNIGTFTAAGVELDTSVQSIKGIANLAAVSGSTSQQASTAMYQLSQAMAAGTVKLMDWNSVVNAGMGGQVFQDSLKETARAHGIAIDTMIKDEGSFRETLQKGWLTTDILTETLSKFTGDLSKSQLKQMGYTEKQAKEILKLGEMANDAATKVKTWTQLWDTLKEAAQSGWTQSWQIIVGDFEEAKELFTEVSDSIGAIIGASADARNSMLSGGLSSGWDQFINLGVGDEEAYKDTVSKVAKKQGVDIDALTKKYGSFEKSLKSGWLTSDIMSTSLQKLTKETSNLSAKELQAKGYTTEQVKALKELNKSVKDGEISIDDYAKKLTQMSGRENIIQSLRNVFKGLSEVMKPLSEAFREVFPPYTGEQLYALTEKIKELTSHFTLSDGQAKQLKATFKGFFSIINIGVSFVKNLVEGIVELLSHFGGIENLVLSVTSGFGNWATSLNDTIESANVFDSTIGFVVKALGSLIDKIKEFASANGAGIMSGLASAAKSLWTVVQGVANKVFEILGTAGSSIIDAIQNGDLMSIIDIIKNLFTAGILLQVKKFIKTFTDQFDLSKKGGIFETFKGIMENVSGVLDSVCDSLKAWQQNLKAGTLLKIAIAIGILSASLIALSGINEESLSSALGAITILFADLVAAMTIFNKLSGGLKTSISTSISMIAMAVSISILASALKKVADLDGEQLKTGLLGISALAGVMAVCAITVSRFSGQMMKGSLGLVLFASAIAILAAVCKSMSELSWVEMAKGLTGVSVLMGGVILFLNTAKMSSKAITTALGIAILGGAMKILASACYDFAGMSWDEIARGLTGVGGLLAELTVFTNFTGNSKKLIGTSITITIIAGALKILYTALRDFASMSLEEIGRGMIAMAGGLAAIVLAAKFMPTAGLIDMSVTFPVIANSMIDLAEGLSAMGKMSWDEIARSLTMFAGSLTLLALAINVMSGNMKGAIALVTVSFALNILAGALTSIGSLDVAGLVIALAGIAGVFTILGVATLVLTPLIPSIFSLSASIAVLAASCIGFGVGLAALGAGLLVIGTSFVGMILALQAIEWTSIVKGLGALAAIFLTLGIAAHFLGPMTGSIVAVSGSIALLGLSCLAVGVSIALITASLASLAAIGEENARTIVETMKIIVVGTLEMIPDIIRNGTDSIIAAVLGLIDIVVECAPELADGLLKVIFEVLESMQQYIPKIVDVLLQFVIDAINCLAENIPDIVSAFCNLFEAVFGEIMDRLKSVDLAKLTETLLGVGVIAGILVALGAITSLVPAAMGGILALSGVVVEIIAVIAALGGISKIPGLMWLMEGGAEILGAIGKAIGSFIGGLAGAVVGGVAEGLSSQLPAIGDDLSAFMGNVQPFLDGAKSISPDTMSGVKALAETILLLTGSEILDAISSWITGGSSIAEFGKDIAEFGPYVKDYCDAVSDINPESVNASANAALALGKMASLIPNEGGLVGIFAGENDMATFGSNLVLFGESFAEYAEKVKDIDPNVVTASSNAATTLSEFAKALPNDGGAAGIFAGENDMATFGSNLVAFGISFGTYANIMSEIDTSSIATSNSVVSAVIDLANQLPKSEGLFSSSNNFTDFGADLANLGYYLSVYSERIGSVNTWVIGSMTDQIKSIASMMQEVSGVDTSGFSTFTKSLESLGKVSVDGLVTQLQDGEKRVKDAIKKIVSAISVSGASNKFSFATTATTLVASLVNSITAKKSSLTSIGNSMMSWILSGMKASTLVMKISTTIAAASIVASFKAKEKEFENAGNSAMSKFAFGMSNNVAKARGIVSGCVTTCVVFLRLGYTRFYSAGSYVVSGFVNGISDNTWRAAARARAMANKAIKAAEDALGEQSPSKVFYKIGAYAGIGFINALDYYGKLSSEAGKDLADSATDGVKAGMDNLNSLSLFSESDQPVITPVVDLQNVLSASNELNDLLQLSDSISLSATASKVFGMRSGIQNGVGNTEIISAIDSLRRSINGIQSTNYTVNGVTYDDGTNISDAVKSLIRAAKIERRA